MKQKIRNTLIILSILYLTLYIPLLITTYSKTWYQNNQNSINYPKNINLTLVQESTHNLIQYLKYSEPLNPIYSEKELIHYKEVRNLYLKLHILAIISIAFLIYILRKTPLKEIKKIPIINIIIIMCLNIFIFMSFQFFWDDIFHPFFFNNTYWLIDSSQISYYIFPIQFFINSILLISTVATSANLIIFSFITRKINKNSNLNNTETN